MAVTIRTSQNVLLDYEPASVGERILAMLIDYLVFFAWALLVFGLPAYLNRSPNTFYVIAATMPLLFYFLFTEWSYNGQSIGKMVMKTRVVMLDGSPPSLGAYLIRWVFRLVESVGFMFGLVPILTVAINGKGQRLGDIAAGTAVVRLKPDVSLNEIQLQEINPDYVVQFPEVRLLRDRDIGIVRYILAQSDGVALVRTADKIKEVTGIESRLSAREFLETVLRDYQFISLQ